jgi:hypothetical protein
MGAKKKVSLPTKRVPVKNTTQQPVAQMPSGYGRLLENLKARIQTARIRAALAVNRELVLLYWDIGRQILQRQESVCRSVSR